MVQNIQEQPPALAQSLNSSAPSVGNYYVERTFSSYSVCGPIVKTSDKLVYIKRYGNRLGQTRRDDLVFVGGKEVCERLVEKIRSSQALRNQETNASNDRHRLRVEKLIAGARGDGDAKLSPASGPDEATRNEV